MLLTLTPVISLQALTLTFMPGSLMHVEVVIYPEPWPIFDDSLKVCFLCETLEMFPCCFTGEAYTPAWLRDTIAYDVSNCSTLSLFNVLVLNFLTSIVHCFVKILCYLFGCSSSNQHEAKEQL